MKSSTFQSQLKAPSMKFVRIYLCPGREAVNTIFGKRKQQDPSELMTRTSIPGLQLAHRNMYWHHIVAPETSSYY